MCCHTVYLHTPSLSFEAMMVAIWATQVGISETPHSLRSWTRGQYLTAPGPWPDDEIATTRPLCIVRAFYFCSVQQVPAAPRAGMRIR
jgi:hypothetical protein